MATQLFLGTVEDSNTWTGTLYYLPRIPTSPYGTAQWPVHYGVSTARGGGAVSVNVFNTVTGPTSGVDGNSTQMVWALDPLAADVTISGTITFNIWGFESSMNANAGFQVTIYRRQPDGTTTTIVDSERGTEMNTTTSAVNNWTASPTSTACTIGDIILIRVRINDAGGTMASGFTATLRAGGNTAAADGDTYVTFNENLTFLTTEPAGTVVRLLDDASDLAGAGQKKMWTDAAGGVVSNVTNTVTLPSEAQVTASAGGQALEWFTPKLQAVTLDDLIKVEMFGQESSNSANISWRAKLYKTASDGTSAVLIGDATSASNSSSEPSAGANNYVRWFMALNTSLTDQQRLRLVVFQCSSCGNGSGSGFTCTLAVEDTTNPTRLTFTETLTEFVPANPAIYPVMPTMVAP